MFTQPSNGDNDSCHEAQRRIEQGTREHGGVASSTLQQWGVVRAAANVIT